MSSFTSDHGRTMETSLHVHRRWTDGMRQEYFRDAYVASRCYDDRSTSRKDHVVLRRMARGLRNDGLGRRAVRGLPTAAMFESTTRNFIVIDDLMAETDERVTTLFTKKSHHRNTSVLYLVQNLFPQKKSRTICLNSQYMVVFKNPRDASQMSHLARQMYPGRVKFVQGAFKDATSVPYGYLLVDLKQDTPEDMRLRTAIFPDDGVQYVYLPKV